MKEFELIASLRARLAQARSDVAVGIGDDAAVLDLPAGQQLVACTDTLVEGVHFLPATAPADLGWKSLAVNLSDLAAMGATPAWALLALTLPVATRDFVTGFAEGFGALAAEHGVALVGGDTTQGPLAVTVTALGWLPGGAAISRAGARDRDEIFVTGTLGDAAGALRCLHEAPHATANPQRAALASRMQRPQPRVAAGLALRGIASACIDVSDGLLADFGHVCAASGVGAELHIEALPISAALMDTFDAADCRELALTGGDDYELCFSVPAARVAAMQTRFDALGLPVTRIGRVLAGSGVRVLDAHGRSVDIKHAGWEHFAS